jgi:hypothetical protein
MSSVKEAKIKRKILTENWNLKKKILKYETVKLTFFKS